LWCDSIELDFDFVHGKVRKWDRLGSVEILDPQKIKRILLYIRKMFAIIQVTTSYLPVFCLQNVTIKV